MTALEVADWRRRTFALYEAVRHESDPAVGHARWRAERDRMFSQHPSTPVMEHDRASFTGLPVEPYDPAWRFEVELTEAAPAHFDFETGTDGIVPFDRLGIAEIPGVGSLDVWRLTTYGGGIFIPVRDALAGRHGGTYGGGRYLVDSIKGANLNTDAAPDTLVLDFNFAYNPSCAYDPAWACPLAQPGNRVSVEIPVGERYSGAY
jgi:uncharacterized protein (DUF1684 family)